MGQLVFQATAGGQVALVGPNPSTSFSLNLPAINGTLITSGDTGTVTNTMLASNIYTAPGTIGSVTPNTGAFTTLSASSTVSGTGFSNYLASPPAIGGTAPSTGKFTTLTSTLNVINGATSGAITLAVPAVAGSNTATLPAATGTVMVSGNMPAFSATNTGSQSVASGTFTKIQFNSKEFDTASAYDNATNYRFTPQVAGYYQVSSAIFMNVGSNLFRLNIAIYKNGSEFADNLICGNANGSNSTISVLVFLNGTTDYLESYVQQDSGTNKSTGIGRPYNYFQATLVRAA
jgi:hypothetical protein